MAPGPDSYWILCAFTARPGRGNPAAVVPIDSREWPTDAWLADTAAGFRGHEGEEPTRVAFVIRRDADADGADGLRYGIRWWTLEGTECPLCGHATLCASFVLLYEATGGAAGGEPRPARVVFDTRSAGTLVADAVDVSLPDGEDGDEGGATSAGVRLSLPWLDVDESGDEGRRAREQARWRDALVPGGGPDAELIELVGTTALTDTLLALRSAEALPRLRPDLDAVAAMGGRGAIVTAAAAPGGTAAFDFSSRFFDAGTRSEDPVTGSAHGAIAPYWYRRWGDAGRTRFTALQCSPRQGRLAVELRVDERRVLVSGRAVVVVASGV